MTPEQIAASLTKAQRDALLKCTPWDVCVGAGIAIAFCANGLLQLSSTGQQVRAILEKNNG